MIFEIAAHLTSDYWGTVQSPLIGLSSLHLSPSTALHEWNINKGWLYLYACKVNFLDNPDM